MFEHEASFSKPSWPSGKASVLYIPKLENPKQKITGSNPVGGNSFLLSPDHFLFPVALVISCFSRLQDSRRRPSGQQARVYENRQI